MDGVYYSCFTLAATISTFVQLCAAQRSLTASLVPNLQSHHLKFGFMKELPRVVEVYHRRYKRQTTIEMVAGQTRYVVVNAPSNAYLVIDIRQPSGGSKHVTLYLSAIVANPNSALYDYSDVLEDAEVTLDLHGPSFLNLYPQLASQLNEQGQFKVYMAFVNSASTDRSLLLQTSFQAITTTTTTTTITATAIINPTSTTTKTTITATAIINPTSTAIINPTPTTTTTTPTTMNPALPITTTTINPVLPGSPVLKVSTTPPSVDDEKSEDFGNQTSAQATSDQARFVGNDTWHFAVPLTLALLFS